MESGRIYNIPNSATLRISEIDSTKISLTFGDETKSFNKDDSVLNFEEGDILNKIIYFKNYFYVYKLVKPQNISNYKYNYFISKWQFRYNEIGTLNCITVYFNWNGSGY